MSFEEINLKSKGKLLFYRMLNQQQTDLRVSPRTAARELQNLGFRTKYLFTKKKLSMKDF